jgi:hypothetical protein
MTLTLSLSSWHLPLLITVLWPVCTIIAVCLDRGGDYHMPLFAALVLFGGAIATATAWLVYFLR